MRSGYASSDYVRSRSAKERGRRLPFFLVLLLLTGILALWAIHKEASGSAEAKVEAKAAVLIDASTGKVLYESNADEAMPPASMSKMMTELLVLDAVDAGELKWEDAVTTSRYASEVTGAGIGFGPNETWTVRELFEAMAVHSANDAAVALAERIAGGEKPFVRRMNERAKQIGMSGRTVFGNATGLSREDLAGFAEASDERDTVMTAKDAAKLAGALIGKYPEILDVTARSSVSLPTAGIRLQTTNMMLKGMPYSYAGSDGLKTGYTAKAGYCFTGTAKRDGRRLIAVVMGTKTADARFTETEKLFRLGFKDGSLLLGSR